MDVYKAEEISRRRERKKRERMRENEREGGGGGNGATERRVRMCTGARRFIFRIDSVFSVASGWQHRPV